MEHSYKYILVGSGQTYETATEFESLWPEDEPKYLAETAAQHHYLDQEKLPGSWPKKLQIWTATGRDLGIFTVAAEIEQIFYATKLEVPT
jgi:hypothetical protein